MKFHIMKTMLAILWLSLFGMSCGQGPGSKEQYLQEYEAFLEKLDGNQADYSPNDWKAHDELFQKYQTEWYQKFEADLSPNDKRQLSQYQRRYDRMKNSGSNILPLDGLENLIQGAAGFLESGKLDEIKQNLSQKLNGAVNSKEFEQAMDELKGAWNGELKGELENSLKQLDAAIQNGEIERGIQQSVDKLVEVLEDEEIKGDMRAAVDDLKQALEKMEQKLQE